MASHAGRRWYLITPQRLFSGASGIKFLASGVPELLFADKSAT